MVRVRVDRECCVGAGNCVRTLPAVFDQDDEWGLVVLLRADLPDAQQELVREVADLCPSGAISVAPPGAGNRRSPPSGR
jgi:ferredoxin